MTPKTTRLATFGAAFLCVGLLVSFVVFVNPFNWGVRKSERFSEVKFNAIRQGEPIAAVIERLGKPLTITKNVAFPGVCNDGECDVYAFTGFASKWIVAHREAWVIANHKGRVVHTVMNVEP